MRLTVLGNSTPYPRPDAPCSGYLVQHGSTSIWVDAGSGTLAELQRHHGLDTLDAIWISHSHADHTADLLSAYYALQFADLTLETPIPLFAPPGTFDQLSAFLGSNSAEKLPEAFELHEHSERGEAAVGELRLRWRAVQHSVPGWGLRVESADAALAYSGDTARCDALLALATGASALLCEAGHSAHPDPLNPGHMTPEEAGAVAGEAAAGKLILTHLGQGMAPAEAARRAATTFAGPLEVATPGVVFEIG